MGYARCANLFRPPVPSPAPLSSAQSPGFVRECRLLATAAVAKKQQGAICMVRYRRKASRTCNDWDAPWMRIGQAGACVGRCCYSQQRPCWALAARRFACRGSIRRASGFSCPTATIRNWFRLTRCLSCRLLRSQRRLPSRRVPRRKHRPCPLGLRGAQCPNLRAARRRVLRAVPSARPAAPLRLRSRPRLRRCPCNRRAWARIAKSWAAWFWRRP